MKDKKKPLIQIGIWALVFVVLIVFNSFGTNNTSNTKNDNKESKKVEEKKEFINYDEMINNLLKNNYEYKYTIEQNNIKYIFNGKKLNKEEIGYKEINNDIKKYYINENITYILSSNGYIEYNNLYSEFDNNFINIDTLFENLKNYLYKVDKMDNSRIINYNKDGFQVTVETDYNNIKKINIKNDNTEYILEFYNIGLVEKVDKE